jgi:hypothetical protein
MTTELKNKIAAINPNPETKATVNLLGGRISAEFTSLGNEIAAEIGEDEITLDLENMQVVKYEDDAEGHSFAVVSRHSIQFFSEKYW